MARKRMFDNEIISQDDFMDLPKEAIALYFLLGMEADDEGFIAPKKVMRIYNISNDTLKILIAKNYIIPFETGVVVITDWRRNNYLDKNKITNTIYQEERQMLLLDKEKGKYLLNPDISTVKLKLNQSLTEVKKKLKQSSIEESSIEESRVVENSKENDVSKINDLMIECLNTTNINNIKECIEYLDKLPIELIEYALKKTSRIDRPSWKYAMSILDSYIQNGFTNLKEIEADELKFKNINKLEKKEETFEEQVERYKKEWGLEDET